jgi:hypothetical protein
MTVSFSLSLFLAETPVHVVIVFAVEIESSRREPKIRSKSKHLLTRLILARHDCDEK